MGRQEGLGDVEAVDSLELVVAEVACDWGTVRAAGVEKEGKGVGSGVDCAVLVVAVTAAEVERET